MKMTSAGVANAIIRGIESVYQAEHVEEKKAELAEMLLELAMSRAVDADYGSNFVACKTANRDAEVLHDIAVHIDEG